MAALLACSRAAPEETPSVETLFLSANDAQARGDRVGAERSLRRALARATDARATEADRRLEVSVRATLAALLVQSQRETEAREVARPACGRGAHGESAPQLVVLGLCAR